MHLSIYDTTQSDARVCMLPFAQWSGASTQFLTDTQARAVAARARIHKSSGILRVWLNPELKKSGFVAAEKTWIADWSLSQDVGK